MTYSAFLEEMNENDSVTKTFFVASELENDILKPQFFDSIAEYKGLELKQGQYFVEVAQFKRQDQFICVLNGKVEIALVSQIYRNQMYPG